MGFPRPQYDIADIVRTHRDDLEKQHRLSISQKRVLTAISRCRTAALGGHLTLDPRQRVRWRGEVCTGCGYEHPAYNSCRNRHCPKCQALAQEKWIAARSQKILHVPHFHLVFTLPAELRPLAMWHPVEVYTAFFHAVSELLLELGRTHLEATLGLTMVLHTWTRELAFHPHIHVLTTAGGLALEGSQFVHVKKSKRGKHFLFHVTVMGQLLRGKMLDALRKLHRKGALPELAQPAFDQLMASLAAPKSWVVYAKAPFRKSQHVLSYLGRYTHRVGIANSRLVDVTEDHITFNTKHGKTITLHPVEFLRRFVQHVLPDGFHKIRHAGLYASAQQGGLLDQARVLLPASQAPPTPEAAPTEVPLVCPNCGGILLRIPLTSLPRPPPPAPA